MLWYIFVLALCLTSAALDVALLIQTKERKKK